MSSQKAKTLHDVIGLKAPAELKWMEKGDETVGPLSVQTQHAIVAEMNGKSPEYKTELNTLLEFSWSPDWYYPDRKREIRANLVMLAGDGCPLDQAATVKEPLYEMDTEEVATIRQQLDDIHKGDGGSA